MRRLCACMLAVSLSAAVAAQDAPPPGRVVNVSGPGELRRALGAARPGDRIRLAAGRYGSLTVENVRGEPGRPVTVESADAANPAVFGEGASGLHLIAPQHVTLRAIVVRDVTTNGINIDDGGSRSKGPAVGIRLENVRVERVAPKGGNNDAIKLSGVDQFHLTGCTVDGWSSSAVDMVGCHDGLIEDCAFRGKDGYRQYNAVQIKGGSRNVVVRRCLIADVTHRGVNMGGSTGKEYFRPPLEKLGPEAYEAQGCVVEGCTFIGGESAVAFVSQTDCTVRCNTIYRPGKWAFRILQESRGQPFVPSRRGVVEQNLVVFRPNEMRVAVNVGPFTDAGSFTFRGNAWYAEGIAAASRPSLPAEETGGTYGVDPKLKDPEKRDLTVTSDELRQKVGPGAMESEKSEEERAKVK